MLAPETISLNRETRKRLEKLKRELEERFDLKLSYSNVILHLINYYEKRLNVIESH